MSTNDGWDIAGLLPPVVGLGAVGLLVLMGWSKQREAISQAEREREAEQLRRDAPWEAERRSMQQFQDRVAPEHRFTKQQRSAKQQRSRKQQGWKARQSELDNLYAEFPSEKE